ncbi:MAG TPA: alpha/beta hydrolase [Gemmataceae bacterium]|nr:alpha/beta hydrolase [Gemmataceae bacterium]
MEIPGGQVFARRWDPAVVASGIPLVLLHDSLGCVGLWRDFPAALARRLSRPVIAYDRLGYGRSSPLLAMPSADFIHKEAEEHFPAVLSKLGVHEFILFGHSVGGAMALLIASRAADSCVAVVSESAQAFVEERTLSGIRKAREQFQGLGQLDRLRRWHGAKAEWVLGAWTGVWLSPEFASWSLEPDLPSVRCPVLALHGDRDEYGSARFPELICRLAGGPTELHILEGCGHVPHRERRDVVAELVAGFLAARRRAS